MIFTLNEQEKRKKPFTKKDAGNVEYNNSVFNNSTMCESDEDIEEVDIDNYTKQYEKLWGYVHQAFSRFIDNLPDDMKRETGLDNLNKGFTDTFLKNFNDIVYTITDNLFDNYYTGKSSFKESLTESLSENENKELLDDCAEYIRTNDRDIWIEDAYTTNEGFAFVVDGDWKHDHLRLDHLIEKFFVDTEYVIFIHEVTTESDGSDNYKAIHYVRIENISEQIADGIDFSGTVGVDHFEGLVSDEDLEKIETFLDGCDAQIYYNNKSNTYLIKDTSADFGPYTLPELLEDIIYTLSQWDKIDSEE